MKRAWFISGLTAAAGIGALSALLVAGGCGANSPFNSENLGNMVGGPTGQLIKAGGHEANAMALSEKDEDAMGQAVGAQLTSHYGVYEDVRVETYVTLVGLTVASAEPEPRRELCVRGFEHGRSERVFGAERICVCDAQGAGEDAERGGAGGGFSA